MQILTKKQVHGAVNTLGILANRVLQEAQASIATERQAAERQKELTANFTRQEIARLQEQNASLSKLMESERRESSKARETLIKRISSLLVDYSNERDQSLRDAVFGVQSKSEETARNFDAYQKDQDAISSDVVVRGREWQESLSAATKSVAESKRVASEVRVFL